jgi:hypothetical protein
MDRRIRNHADFRKAFIFVWSIKYNSWEGRLW